jgi:hypothetical protein
LVPYRGARSNDRPRHLTLHGGADAFSSPVASGGPHTAGDSARRSYRRHERGDCGNCRPLTRIQTFSAKLLSTAEGEESNGQH